MLSRNICTIFLFVYISIAKCEDDKDGNFTVKYKNKSEIHFIMNDSNALLLQAQLEAMRLEQRNLFAELSAKVDKLMASNLLSSQFPDSCAKATAMSRRSGAYQIVIPDYSVHPFIVSCDEDTQNGGWLVILRREDGSLNFFRYWNDYKNGFGNVSGEFFIGLDKLHLLTKERNQELLISMEDFKGNKRYAKYTQFSVGSEQNLYALQTLGEYSGDAGDSLSPHLGQKFTARDRDNDNYSRNCAELYTGGWWYDKCHSSNLMGKYNDSTHGKGINWLLFSGHTASLKFVQMMIRNVQ
ncbi:ficolin-1-like [Drosophila hydei]|uniref:Ficolin-1-like n=1 Tax=Drosophila hydei TaxID=7224 RepID=A0A6J1LEY5_DROHY|nr:ficolin-1-like [Drosophila hydei]